MKSKIRIKERKKKQILKINCNYILKKLSGISKRNNKLYAYILAIQLEK